ncbi:DUF2306 domain-containing protein [Aurantimonas endophytica]|uniref:Putative membrane protein n=1 Tax=Aurantimonas endophytica TaxID=1522175 RepID=A0A7W6H9X1_9HYPH|nr:DUF2306 domain-containing protein [Aurantimonas endophytica]MBB4001296.1 putative membrane protein [Aurantimonas endophytica]MCO6403060.1 hypothetical protein [Aurantimonas endophytica]
MSATAPEMHVHGTARASAFDRGLSLTALGLLCVVLVAIGRGRPHWSEAPSLVWAHLLTIVLALILTVIQLWRPKGGPTHKAIGRVWVALMFGTALITLFIVGADDGGYSVLHILSIWVMIQVPLIAIAARKGQIERHQRAARAMVVGALLIAGFFTFPFHRLLGTWLFG